MDFLNKSAKRWLNDLQTPVAARESRRADARGLPTFDPGVSRVVEEGIAWLFRAQDCSVTKDGGVARHYSLIDGWSASYPETSGYIVATLIAFGERERNNEAVARAQRILDWLVSIQFQNGGFQGGMIDQKPRIPVTFNTGQILIGLAAGAQIDARYRKAMCNAADWLVSTQDDDGCWRRFPTPFAEAGEKVYETHVSLGLLRAAAVEPARGYLEAALKQIDWALKFQAPNGWLANCCLSDPDRPLTHTLGYALRGILEAYIATQDERYLRAAIRTADGLLPTINSEGRLPGRLDSAWRPAADFVCLTGSSQIAECWLLLFKATRLDAYWKAGALANSYVRRTISIDGPPERRGGVKGSFPVDGEYGRWQFLNWACKFMIDANCTEEAVALI